MLSKFFDKIKGWFGKEKHQSIEKPTLIEEISLLIMEFQDFIRICDDNVELHESFAKTIPDHKNDRGRLYVQAYLAMMKNLCPTAVRLETRCMFTAFSETFKGIQHALGEIRQEINALIPGPEINEHNIRISHAEILFFVKIAEIFNTFFSFMYTGLMDEVPVERADIDIDNPKYRINAVNDNLALCTLIINRHFVGNIFKDVKTSIADLKKEGKDLLIFLDDGNHNGEMAETLGAKTAVINGLNIGNIVHINPFLAIGRAYRDMVHLKMLRKQKEKEWMEAKIALLKAQMNKLDPASDEYIALQKLVENYSNQITALDQQLAKYFTDDER